MPRRACVASHARGGVGRRLTAPTGLQRAPAAPHSDPSVAVYNRALEPLSSEEGHQGPRARAPARWSEARRPLPCGQKGYLSSSLKLFCVLLR